MKGEQHVCEVCGVTFLHYVSNGVGRFCSRKCRDSGLAKKHFPCEVCGKPFSPPPNRINKGWGRFCSRTCKAKVINTGKALTPLADRFWEKVAKGDSCWLWTGGKKGRYGQVWVQEQLKSMLTHRVSWELTFGPIPDGLFVCHHCDTPLCVKPGHLYLGTAAENMRDAKIRRRLATKHNGRWNGDRHR